MINILKSLVVVLVVGLSAEVLLADRLFKFSGNGSLIDKKSGVAEYPIVLQLLNDSHGLHYHWLYLDEHGHQTTRNCFYLREYFGGYVEVLAPTNIKSCLDIGSYQLAGWGHSLRSEGEHEFLLSYRDSTGGQFTVSIREDRVKESLRVTGHYLNDGSILQHWFDSLQLIR